MPTGEYFAWTGKEIMKVDDGYEAKTPVFGFGFAEVLKNFTQL